MLSEVKLWIDLSEFVTSQAKREKNRDIQKNKCTMVSHSELQNHIIFNGFELKNVGLL